MVIDNSSHAVFQFCSFIYEFFLLIIFEPLGQFQPHKTQDRDTNYLQVWLNKLTKRKQWLGK